METVWSPFWGPTTERDLRLPLKPSTSLKIKLCLESKLLLAWLSKSPDLEGGPDPNPGLLRLEV